MEWALSSIKTKRVRKKVSRSRDQARAGKFESIGHACKSSAKHSTPGHLGPLDFKRQAEGPNKV